MLSWHGYWYKGNSIMENGTQELLILCTLTNSAADNSQSTIIAEFDPLHCRYCRHRASVVRAVFRHLRGNPAFHRFLIVPLYLLFNIFQTVRDDDPIIGVNRIWTHPSARRKGIASELLDVIRKRYFTGVLVPRHR